MRMQVLTVYLTDRQLEALNQLVRLKVYPSVSEAVRAAVRELIEDHVSSKAVLVK